MLESVNAQVEIEDKVYANERLAVDDIVYMYESADVNWLGGFAHNIATELTQDRVSFVSNLILNYTNICNVRCKFCAFYRTGKEDDSYAMSEDQVIQEIGKYYDRFQIRQLLIQGGVNPALDLGYYTSLFRRIRKEFPKLGIHGLSTSEFSFIARKAKLTIPELLKVLRESGLETVPGAGAEIFDSNVRKVIGRPPNSGAEWLSIMEEAHKLGIRTSATMMFGHVEKSIDKAHHLLSIYDLQKKYHGFLSFTPWSFEPGNTQLEREGLVSERAGGLEVLRNIAVSRIVFNRELPVVQSSWLTNGVEMGQLAILYGANDWGGTIYDEKVIPATGKAVGNLQKEIIVESIKQLGLVPVERDNLYHPVRVYDT